MNSPEISSIQLPAAQEAALRALARSGSLVSPFVDTDAYDALIRRGFARSMYSNVVVITDVGRDFAAGLADR
jgi:hypothetical protein